MTHALKQPLSSAHAVVRRVATRIGLAAVLTVAAFPAMAQTAVDDALLTIERPDIFYTQMPALAAALGPALEVADKQNIPALTQQGEKLAQAAFDDKQNLSDIRAALAKTPDASAVGKDLPAIAARLREHEAAIDSMSLKEAEMAGDKFEAQLNARADKAVIQKISTLMAAPAFAGETMVAAKRLKWIYEAIILGNGEKLRALPKSEIDEGLRQILAESRNAQGERPGPFMQQMTIESWRLRKQAVLTQLSKDDVAALDAFYASAPGRAKRAALVNTFVANNDKAATAVIRGLMADIR